ncbi:hypothetical protein PASE110613_09345 [Paenibacillus sediminis]|uniref:Uncharacterized protein n=1 Tax=Paenibacillus sediminis TaxID=664909 RepID=A0ABS4H6K2_9BACL|nr:hypothetical protein [Paenibacillus sediminis]MBP1938147.1 hypothetical protein [Paenibacillus sediminis]
MLNKEQQFASDISELIWSLFDEESENYRYNLENIDATAFFTGLAMTFGIIYNNSADADEDFIGGTHLANRLAFQYLMNNGKEAA